MKTASTILRSAESLGIELWVEGGQIRYKARQPVSDGFKSRIRQHKAEIINLLSREPGGVVTATRPTLPSWCNSRCEHRHRLELPDLGAVEWCCFEQDANHWRRVRIGTMNGCPMKEEN